MSREKRSETNALFIFQMNRASISKARGKKSKTRQKKLAASQKKRPKLVVNKLFSCYFEK